MPQGRNINQIRVLRVNAYTPDLARVFKPNMLPGLTRVHGLVNAIAVRNIAPDVVFSGAHINDVRVRLRPRNRSNRRGSEILPVADRLPVRPGVFRFPDTPADTAEIKCVGSGFDTCYRCNASASEGTYRPPFQCLQDTHLLCL